MPRPRRIARSVLLTLLFVIVLDWSVSRWIAVDVQTGSRLVCTLTQGAAVWVAGEVGPPVRLAVEPNEDDEVCWQWWFAAAPHSCTVPLWALAAACGLGALVIRGGRAAPAAT